MEIQRLSGLTRTQFNLLSLPDAVKLMPWNIQKLIQDELRKEAFLQFLTELFEDELVFRGNRAHWQSICPEIEEAFDENAAGTGFPQHLVCVAAGWVNLEAGESLGRLLKKSDDEIATKIIQDLMWGDGWLGSLSHEGIGILPNFTTRTVWKNWGDLMTEHRLEVLKLVIEMEIKGKESLPGWNKAVAALRARFPTTDLLDYWLKFPSWTAVRQGPPPHQQARPAEKRRFAKQKLYWSTEDEFCGR